MTINNRIDLIIKELGFNNNSFSGIVGTNPTVIHNIIKGRNAPGFELLSKIALSFGKINMNWLITGKGNMYVQEMLEQSPEPATDKPLTKQKAPPGCEMCKLKDVLITSLQQQITTQSKLISKMEYSEENKSPVEIEGQKRKIG